jgi:hypothetical protein
MPCVLHPAPGLQETGMKRASVQRRQQQVLVSSFACTSGISMQQQSWTMRGVHAEWHMLVDWKAGNSASKQELNCMQ